MRTGSGENDGSERCSSGGAVVHVTHQRLLSVLPASMLPAGPGSAVPVTVQNRVCLEGDEPATAEA